MPWSEGVLEQFDIVDLFTTEESEFYGPFTSLLVELFPISEHYYQVSPQIHKPPKFPFQFIVYDYRSHTPLFFLEVNGFRSLTLPSARGKADDHMRESFREFASYSIPMQTLYGVSAFGPQFRVYAFDTDTRHIDPPAIVRDPVVANDIAPEAQWAYNLLQPAGEAKLREVVNAVKGMAAEL